nr:MAG TPA: hypothetical protein [Caudoviricetes sp.]
MYDKIPILQSGGNQPISQPKPVPGAFPGTSKKRT